MRRKTKTDGKTRPYVPPSPADFSRAIKKEGFDSWRLHFFDLVDGIRTRGGEKRVGIPPYKYLDPKLAALLAAAVETLMEEKKLPPPKWTIETKGLKRPWFMTSLESLKAITILESPTHFRERNIFVGNNFLSRA